MAPRPPNGEEGLYLTGDPVWKVRFAPQQTGTWRHRVRATDASGTVQSAEGAFTVVPSALPHNHGLIRVSPTDPGYFEYSDGTPFINNSQRLLGHVSGTTPGWATVTATFPTGPNQYFLDNFYLILENTTGGGVYVDEVSLRELRNGAPAGPAILRKNRFAYHLYFDPQPSWQWDYLFQRAEQGAVTVRPVVLEKNDWIANHLDASGNPVGGYYDLDNDRFYAAPNTAVRRLHEYFRRYLIARRGYSRAVHSWELINAGDPYNGNHYAMADAFGRFMRANDPHCHPVTTSHWHSFPQAEFWANPQYSGVDCADIHEYACCGNRYAGWAQNIWERVYPPSAVFAMVLRNR